MKNDPFIGTQTLPLHRNHRQRFRLAVRRNPEIASFDPLALCNSHYVRELDDSGHIDQLYQ
jgi:hypothetical protein